MTMREVRKSIEVRSQIHILRNHNH